MSYPCNAINHSQPTFSLVTPHSFWVDEDFWPGEFGCLHYLRSDRFATGNFAHSKQRRLRGRTGRICEVRWTWRVHGSNGRLYQWIL
jgi:hypothetical protein